MADFSNHLLHGLMVLILLHLQVHRGVHGLDLLVGNRLVDLLIIKDVRDAAIDVVLGFCDVTRLITVGIDCNRTFISLCGFSHS